MKRFIIALLTVGCAFPVLAQKTVSHNDLVWIGDFTKVKLNDKWSAYFDFGLRRTDGFKHWSQILVRPGVTYQVNGTAAATAGLAWFSHYSAIGIRPEGRIWEQLSFTGNIGRMRWTHRLRAEQRFTQRIRNDELINDVGYTNRFRYQFALQLPLNRSTVDSKTLYLAAANEVMVNSGKEIVSNYFDQNRLSAGIGFKFSNGLDVQFSGMRIFVQKSKTGSFESNNVLVLNLYYTIMRKTKKQDKSD